MTYKLSRSLCGVLYLVLCGYPVGAAIAQTYPSKPIRIIVPTSPGGGVDQMARVTGQKLGLGFGQQVIMDNRPGAAGNIGAELVAKAAPDGYTLIVAAPNIVSNYSLYANLPYDPLKDFAPITLISASPYALVVHPSVPAKTVKEFISLAKSKQGGMIYASGGAGAPGHLGMELLKSLAGFNAVHIPYKGTGPALTDNLAGQVDTHFAVVVAALPFVATGKLRAIAVTGLQRSSVMPNVATIAESGFQKYELIVWYGFLAPAGTPRDVITKLRNEVTKLLLMLDVKEYLTTTGTDPVGNTPEEFAAYMKSEMTKWAKVIKDSKIRAD